MRWFKKDLWKTGIVSAGILLLLVLMAWIPVSATDRHEMTSGLAVPETVMVQATPMINPTIAARTAEEQLTKLQRENDRSVQAWLWNSGAALGTIGAALIAFIGVLVTAIVNFRQWTASQEKTHNKDLQDRQAERDRRDEEQKRWLKDRQAERDRRDEEQKRWLEDRKTERDRRAEERFQDVIEGLSSEREEANVGAAIMLRTFLRVYQGYEQFYQQTFDLVVAHLRLLKISDPPKDPTALGQALVAVFTEAFPLARNELKKRKEKPFNPRSLDASHIILDKAFLWKADLEQIYMPWASLRETGLTEAKLHKAALWHAELNGANLRGADLSEADLGGASLYKADLSGANLSETMLSVSLRDANLREADLSGANLRTADLLGADLRDADLRSANLCGANLNEPKWQDKWCDAKFTGAKYNTKYIQEKDKQGNPIVDDHGKPTPTKPTQWPQDFNPSDARWGLILVDP